LFTLPCLKGAKPLCYFTEDVLFILRGVGLELATRGKAETPGEQVDEILFKKFHVSLPGM
jgi:hypothetical protein